VPWKHESINDVGGSKLGVSVIGVSRASELEKTMLVWRSILDGLEGGEDTAVKAGRWYRAWEWSQNRRKAIQILADGVREELGVWFDFAWKSPDDGYVNTRKKFGVQVVDDAAASWLTPAASPAAVPAKDNLDLAGEKILPLR
jgi:D-arabinose 1-dehydrogenase